MNDNLSFSIVIPTYNEEKDIANTLDNLVSLSYRNKEIIIVDDSNDSTPDIVRSYSDRGVVLIKPEVRQGRCEARNIGIRASKGDILVILNADVLLPVDFLERIKKFYDEGYDAVGCMNHVENTESLFARYVAMHTHRKISRGVFKKRMETLNGIWWTEGFSVKREMLLKTSMFPSGYAVPIEAGEDVRFVDELRAMGCRGTFADDIVIYHIAPSEFNEYWNIRKGRGAGTPQIRRFIDGWSYSKIFKRTTLKALKRLLMFITVIPMIRYNLELARLSDRNTFTETIVFSYAWFIEQLAMTVGEYKSLSKIKRKEKEHCCKNI